MKLITTKVNHKIVSVLLDEKERFVEVHPFTEERQSIVGNIYVGQVKNVKKNINCAFVDIGIGENVFISLEESKHIHYAKKMGNHPTIVQGDEILVQIQKDKHKTKLPKAVTDFSLSGQYVVLTTDRPSAYVSNKITDDQLRLSLKHLLKKHVTAEYGFIARTNCQTAERDVLIAEMKALVEKYKQIKSILPFRGKGSKLLTQGKPYIGLLKDFYNHEVERFLYDDETLYSEVYDYFSENNPAMLDKIAFIDGPLTFDKQLSLEHKIDKLLRKKVWLNSGASIIIEPTEAMTVIDVNTERSTSKKNSEETIFKTNIEAADEMMRQIRVRNISGIVIVDFIDMADEHKKEALLKHLKVLALKDPQKVVVFGMTALGLVEMTRKKNKATLSEQWLSETR